MNQPLFAQLVQTVNYIPSTWKNAANQSRTVLLQNDNLLLAGQSMAYPGAHGIKTGATPNANFCLVAGATRFGRSMTTVVLGCANDPTRHNEAKRLLDFGFSFPKITSVSRPISDPSSGHFIVTGQSLPNASITIRAGPSLPGTFSFLGSTTANSSTGVFQFFDAGAATMTKRFYQASTP
jgi:D-alanyl-D-alanine carboxypeptidase